MNNIKSISDQAPPTKRLNYFNASGISNKLYTKILAHHETINHKNLDNCIVFSVMHLSTTVNLSIANQWSGIFKNLYLIPKKSSLNKDLLVHISDPTRIIKSRSRRNFETTVEEVLRISATSTLPIIIIDIGGYFAPFINAIQESLGNRRLLIIEDTANGHKKYESTRIFKSDELFKSVAFSPHKMAENVMVANLIVANLPSFIQSWNLQKKMLVIGYGRIGRSLCLGLRAHGAKSIYVLDQDATRLFMAATENFPTLNRSDMNSYNDFFDYCFSMSGDKGTDFQVARLLKNNSWITFVTSSDDELSPDLIEVIDLQNGMLQTSTNKKINIINHGHPINLTDGAIFDTRNLSLHFTFTRILIICLEFLELSSKHPVPDDLFDDIIKEIKTLNRHGINQWK